MLFQAFFQKSMNDINLNITPELFKIGLSDRYDKIFKYLTNSSVWSKYRKKVFGKDLYQLSFTSEQNLKELIEYGEIDSNTTIADIGYGAGGILNYILIKTNAKIDGFDISKSALDYCKQLLGKTTKDVKLYRTNLNDINLESNRYDLIYSIDSHYFIKERDRLFEQINGGLKEEGTLILLTQIFKSDPVCERDTSDKLYNDFISSIESRGFVLKHSLKKTAELEMMSKRQRHYWIKFKDELITEIPKEMWSAFLWEHTWTENKLLNNELKRYFLVFTKK